MARGPSRLDGGRRRSRVVRVVAAASSLAPELRVALAGAAGIALFALALLGLLVMGTVPRSAQSPSVTPACTVADPDAGAPPADLMPIYARAAARYALGPEGWAMLAAINGVETQFGRSELPGVHSGANEAGAAGPMQIGIGGRAGDTWRTYGVDADRDGEKDVHDPDDAIHAAARYLRAGGAPRDWYHAIFSYNHADWYVRKVRHRAATLLGACDTWTYAAATVSGDTAGLRADGTAIAPAGAPDAVKRMIAAANRIARRPYVSGGGHGSWQDGGYDCSGLTSYVLHAAGYLDRPLTSNSFSRWGAQGPGAWVTLYANTLPDGDERAHVFMVIAGLRLDTGGGDRHGSAWRPADRTRARPYAGFFPRHPPGL